MEERNTEVVTQQPANITVKKGHAATWLLLLIIVLAAGAGAYYWRDAQAKSQRKADQAKIAELETQVKNLEAQASPANSDTSEPAAELTEEAKENIVASITSGNTAALAGYMDKMISVIIAASEGVGERSISQAITDLKYLDDATDPWNFELPESVLTKYQTGDYKTYFKSNSIVGKSADGKVVSINFSEAGKINGIFMAVSDSLL